MGTMNSFVDELVKISQEGRVIPLLQFLRGTILPAAKRHAGKAGYVGAGGAGILGAQRVGENMSFAERARDQGFQV